MSAKKTGLLVYFDEDRRSDLLQEKVEGGIETFSDALSIHDWEMGRLSIALLCFSENSIDYIALAKKGNRVVTSKSRVEFSSILSLGSISIDALESKLPERLRQYLIRASRGVGGSIPSGTWSALIQAIKSERQELSGEIDRLLSLRRYSGFRLHGKAAEILTQEREALGIALDILTGGSKLRERVLTEWSPYEDSVEDLSEADSTARLGKLQKGESSFLSRLPNRYVQEEAAIQHDLFNWPGMTPTHEAGVSVFTHGAKRLEVFYANRNDLEHTLGVDLIYYSERYELFILVQYKLMRKEGEHLLYRPDAQLEEELSRMNSLYASTRATTAIQSHSEYRLCDDGFMVKMVPNDGLRPASGELIKGMYLPREYFHFLLGPNGQKGVRGGRQITFEGSPRYLTNSQFAASVHAGWIGTRGVQSQAVRSMIKNFYETGRALVVAYETEAPK